MDPRQLFIWLAAVVLVAYAVTPVEVVGTKFFLQGGSQFYIKGVNYINTNGSVEFNALKNGAQCALDAPLMKNLGVNTVRLGFISGESFGADADYDTCMQSFSDNGIYVLVPLTTGSGNEVLDYNLTIYSRFASIIDKFQQYDNTLGFEIIPIFNRSDNSLLLKSMFRDLRTYRDISGYRSIPIGLADMLHGSVAPAADWLQLLTNFTFCTSPDSDGSLDHEATPEFYGIVSYAWCGTSTFQQSGYDTLTTVYGSLGLPIFFAETGCSDVPRLFSDQSAIFGPQMVNIWSGAIITQWDVYPGGFGLYDLVSYTASDSIQLATFGPATPTPKPDYYNLSSQWATLNPAGTTRQSSKTFPACPTSNSLWSIASSATLPTIAGLVIASGTGGRMPTATSGDGGGRSTSKSSGGFSKGAAIGIGVGVGLLLVIAVVLFALFRRRRNNRRRMIPATPASDTAGKSEMYAGPVDVTIAGPVKPKSELPTGSVKNRKNNTSELHGKPSMTVSARELPGAAGANAPWVHSDKGYMPPELNSSPVFEAGQGTSNKTMSESLDVSEGSSSGRGTVAEGATPNKIDPVRPAMASTDGNEPGFDDSELAEEADIAVQELGLISVRKRTLAGSAAAAGVRPEDLPGRKGEEYAELVLREQRVRGRLEEIEKQRHNLVQR